jgi:succinate dehydrogenase / fumarate reductase flavoprotein subunit
VSSEDNSGDLQMALFRKGVGIAGSEFGGYDVFTCEPDDLAHTMGVSICVDGPNMPYVYDANHERLFADDVTRSNHILCSGIVRAIYEDGRGTEDNRMYVHYTDEDNPVYYITKNINKLKEFGCDPYEGYVKIYPEMYEHGGQPIVDINMMTEYKGLFTPRGTNALGAWGGWISTHNKLFSNYVGKCVVDYLEDAEPFNADDIDWSPVDAEYNRLHEVRTKTSQNGIYPHELRAMIQDAGGLGFDYYRPTAQMEEAIEELVRIRKEELPKQVISNSSPTFNTEWKCAIENINILTAAEMSVRGALMREESRLCYRPEFPEPDDENWGCTLVCKLVDGEMVFEKRPPSKDL